MDSYFVIDQQTHRREYNERLQTLSQLYGNQPSSFVTRALNTLANILISLGQKLVAQDERKGTVPVETSMG